MSIILALKVSSCLLSPSLFRGVSVCLVPFAACFYARTHYLAAFGPVFRLGKGVSNWQNQNKHKRTSRAYRYTTRICLGEGRGSELPNTLLLANAQVRVVAARERNI